MDLKRMKQIGWFFVITGVLCSLFLWSQRMQSEADYNNVQMIVNYSDVVALANANDLTEEEFAQMLQQRGVSAVLFKEWSLGSLNANGQIAIEVGNNIEYASFTDAISDKVPITAANAYIALLDKEIALQVKEHVLLKVPSANYYSGNVDIITIPIMVPNGDSEVITALNNVKEIGVGFDLNGITRMSDLGLGIVPQLRSWASPTDESLREAFTEIEEMPNMEYLLFNDKAIPGYPNKIRAVANLLKDDAGNSKITIGTIEFSDQKGLNQLGILLNKDVIRLHTIANTEMANMTPDTALDRWLLAARERNMRSLLVRFFDITTPGSNLQGNLEYIESIQRGLLDSGFVLDQTYRKPASVYTNNLLLALIGVGVAAGVMLILLEMRLPKLSILVMLSGTAVWLALLLVDPIMAKKMMSLLSVITFPTLSCLLFMKPEASSVRKAVLTLLKMCAISYIGAILMVGMMADILFMLKLDQFIGVKLAHVVPIVAVPFILYIWNEEKPLTFVKQLLEKALDYKWTILGVLVAVAGVIYLSRTGNSGAELSAAESAMRTFLNDVMGVRPRSKEFLIGYPFALLLFWMGASRKNWLLTIPAIIGQVSLVNTYAHIHTALIMSVQRSLNGLILGIAVGLLLIAGVKILLIIYHKMEQREL
ncbi:MAG: hypothetical protein J6J59_01245 [Peptococcaceae bacterium]|nr:hypothetical protein [Peptococcaceae bacterium]